MLGQLTSMLFTRTLRLRGFDAGQLTSMLFPRTLRLRGFDAGPADFHAFYSDTASKRF